MQFDTPISKHWQLAPGDSGLAQGVDDIDLCIHNILSTRKGSDVTRPDFGSNHFDYIDTPEDVFVPNIVREVVLAIQTWEKRADVEDVTFSGHAPHITMTVRWRVADDVSGEVYSTAVNLENATWIWPKTIKPVASSLKMPYFCTAAKVHLGQYVKFAAVWVSAKSA